MMKKIFLILPLVLLSCGKVKDADTRKIDESFIEAVSNHLRENNSFVCDALRIIHIAHDFSDRNLDEIYKDSVDRMKYLNSKEIEKIVSENGAVYTVSKDGSNLFKIEENYLPKMPSELMVPLDSFKTKKEITYILSQLSTNDGSNFYITKYITNTNTSGYIIYFPEIDKIINKQY